MRVEELEPVDLDALVARARGLNVLGRAWVEDTPEGGLCILSNQEKHQDTTFNPREQYVYLPQGDTCACEFGWGDGWEDPAIFGHHWLCLQPVPEYSRRIGPAMLLLMQERVAVWPHNDYWFAQRQQVNEHAPVAAGDTPMRAIARAVVKAAFGDTIETPQVNGD